MRTIFFEEKNVQTRNASGLYTEEEYVYYLLILEYIGEN